MSRQRPRRGYVLLLTLVLLALAAAAMTGVSLRSLAKSVDASKASDQLQCRWGTMSIRSVVLSRAEAVLQSQERATGQPCGLLRRDVTLGNMSFTLLFSDEDAKVNANLLYETLGGDACMEAISQLSPPELPQKPRLRLSPASGVSHSFSSLGQIFQDDSPGLYAGRGNVQTAATTLLTCWGSTRVNFHRASQRALLMLTRLGFQETDLQQLIKLRDSQPGIVLETAMSDLNWSADTRVLARKYMTDQTTCHGLWILPHANLATGDESFTVEEDTPQSGRTEFSW